MKNGSGSTQSLWLSTNPLQLEAPLTYDTQADVCIVGAGVAGLTAAYHLLRQGKSVILVDDGEVCSGESSRTTAHLSNAIDDLYTEMEKIHGLEFAQLACASHTAAINRIDEIVRLENIDCNFTRVDGYLFSASGNTDELADEMEAARRCGLAQVEMIHNPPVHIQPGPALRFPLQARFHPLTYFNALRQIILREGGHIYCRTHASEISGGHDAHVKTSSGHIINAENILVTTNVPVNDRFSIHTKQAPYRTYVIGAAIPSGSVPDALYWDILDPYHYVRLENIPATQSPTGTSYDVLIVGGEDHKTGQATDFDQRFRNLELWSAERFPMIEEILYRWSGQVMETADGLAYIGRNPADHDNVFIATGDSGMGMTHGTIAGILLCDMVLGRDNPWAKVYDPQRVRVRAAGEYFTENINVARQYGDYFKGGEVRSEDAIEPGSGAIIQSGFDKVAVYRDTDGSIHKSSAICPHLKCVLTWNNFEKTWDCPCHGSRFDAFGHILNGPANSDTVLEPQEAHA